MTHDPVGVGMIIGGQYLLYKIIDHIQLPRRDVHWALAIWFGVTLAAWWIA